MTELIFIAIISYLLGSIPFSLLVARAYGKNLYEIGSKNIGAANVFRATGRIEALLMALIGDAGKGALAVFLASKFSCLSCDAIVAQAIAAFFVVVGHNWPIFLKFKGGRGLATLAGVILFLNWKAILLVLLTMAIFILLTELITKGKIETKGKIKNLFSIFISQVVGRMLGILVAAILLYIIYPETFKIVLGAAILSAIKHIKRTKTFLKGERV